MEEKKTEELTDETLDSVSGGARTIIANTNTPARPGVRDQDGAENQDPPKPRMWY